MRLANDANCLAVSEAVHGAAAGAQTVFAVIITGCGAGVAFNGGRISAAMARQVSGTQSATVDGRDELRYREEVPCYCGNKVVLKPLFGTGFATDYRRLSGHALKGSEIIRLVEKAIR